MYDAAVKEAVCEGVASQPGHQGLLQRCRSVAVGAAEDCAGLRWLVPPRSQQRPSGLSPLVGPSIRGYLHSPFQEPAWEIGMQYKFASALLPLAKTTNCLCTQALTMNFRFP